MASETTKSKPGSVTGEAAGRPAGHNGQPPVAVITGASRGIGEATAHYFMERGWEIITCSREDVSERCKDFPGWLAHIPTDLSRRESTEALVDGAMKVLGKRPLHALVNNAAISPKTAFKERLGCLNGDLNHWASVFELNFFAPLLLCRGFAGALARAKGAVVNITSIAGHSIHPFAGSAYSTSKAGLSALTRELAVEFGQLGVRVNAVSPGEIETAMLTPEYEALVPRIPLQRLGEPDDVAATIYWLCADESRYISGTEIFVTGGQHVY